PKSKGNIMPSGSNPPSINNLVSGLYRNLLRLPLGVSIMTRQVRLEISRSGDNSIKSFIFETYYYVVKRCSEASFTMQYSMLYQGNKKLGLCLGTRAQFSGGRTLPQAADSKGFTRLVSECSPILAHEPQ